MQIAVDTSTLLTPSPRRFVTTLQALRGEMIPILPTVEQQMQRRLPRLAMLDMERRLKLKPPPNSRIACQAIEAAGHASLEWWEAEKKRNDTIYEWLDPNLTRQRSYQAEFMRLPASAFADENEEEQMIAAEAIAHHLPLLVSQNYRSIDQEAINQAIRRGQCAPIEIVSIREGVQNISQYDGRPVHGTILHTLVAATQHLAETIDEQIDTMYALCTGLANNERGRSRSQRISTLIEEAIKSAPPREWADAHERATAPLAEAARRTESRLHLHRRDKVQQTGYDPW